MISSLDLDGALAKAGPAAESFARLWEALWQQKYVSAELLELCRLTLARLHADPVELAAANPRAGDGARAQSVRAGKAFGDPAFSAADRAILLFAECYWGDAQSIPDDVADAVKQHLGEPGLVFLIQALGCIDGRIRSARCLRDLGAAHAG